MNLRECRHFGQSGDELAILQINSPEFERMRRNCWRGIWNAVFRRAFQREHAYCEGSLKQSLAAASDHLDANAIAPAAVVYGLLPQRTFSI